jgi:hypothetical protein
MIAVRGGPVRRTTCRGYATAERRIAAYLAEHGPTPGERIAAALGLSPDAFWELINYSWFDVVTGGWGLTARGRAEAIGGADG